MSEYSRDCIVEAYKTLLETSHDPLLFNEVWSDIAPVLDAMERVLDKYGLRSEDGTVD